MVGAVVGIMVRAVSPVIVLAMSIVLAALAFSGTRRFRRVTGRNPWGLPAVAWGIGTLLLSVVGSLLWLTACATSRPRRDRIVGVGVAPVPLLVDAPDAFGLQAEGRPQADIGPPRLAEYPERSLGTPGASRPERPKQLAPLPSFRTGRGTGRPPAVAPLVQPVRQRDAAGWLSDDTGRHELRYHDGTQWTELVSDRGTLSADPL